MTGLDELFAERAPPLVVAFDAGAANIIMSWVLADGRPVRLCCAGPAAEIAERLGLAVHRADDLPMLIEDTGCLLSGTGWSSDLEHDARALAAAKGIKSIAVLDHWVNYAMRFERRGCEVLPDEVWVTNDQALKIARAELPQVPARSKPNTYLAAQVEAAGPAPAEGDLLFLSEPAHSAWGGDQAGEFQSLDYLVAHAAKAGISRGTPLRLRPHPSDPPGKYDAWLAAHPSARLDSSPDVAAALVKARFVAGMNSAALAIALASGRTTICALPPAAPPCVLPLAGLVHLRDIAA